MFGAWTPSCGTTRKNVLNWPFVRSTRVAEPEIDASPTRSKRPALLITDWLVEPPMTAMMFRFDTNRRPTVRASDADSCESPRTTLNLVRLARLYCDTANRDHDSCSCPRNA